MLNKILSSKCISCQFQAARYFHFDKHKLLQWKESVFVSKSKDCDLSCLAISCQSTRDMNASFCSHYFLLLIQMCSPS